MSPALSTTSQPAAHEQPRYHLPEPLLQVGVALETAPPERIYPDDFAQSAQLGYNIVRVADMANSQHMAGMSDEDRCNAVLMALEIAGVDLNFVISDAITRQRALNEREDSLQKELTTFEANRAQRGDEIRTELTRLAMHGQAQLDASQKEVEREQARFRAWQKRRQQESKRILNAAALLMPKDGAAGGESLAALLDRASAARK